MPGMLKHDNNGLFISIEGPDGAGKTTQARLLKTRLENCGVKVLLTREPGGTPVGEEIRKLLLNPEYSEMTVACEVLLYSAARAQLVRQSINPSLKKGWVVISDRYLDSNIVYQGYGGGESPGIIEKINLWAAEGLMPEITFLLDLDAQAGLRRLQEGDKSGKWQGDRVEQKELDYHRRVRQGYLELAGRSAGRIVIIGAGINSDAVHEEIWQRTEPLLRKKDLL
jgi:dTMP kinase